MATPVSSLTTYCSAAEFLLRYDSRLVAQLVSSTGAAVGVSSLAADTALAAVLEDASGDVESACLVGNKYTPTDLAALTGVSSKLLKRIVADLAFQYLRDRRGFKEEADKPNARYQRAMDKLQQLRNGERIFGLQEVMDAGLPTTEPRTEATIESVSQASYTARRFFGVRGDRNR